MSPGGGDRALLLALWIRVVRVVAARLARGAAVSVGVHAVHAVAVLIDVVRPFADGSVDQRAVHEVGDVDAIMPVERERGTLPSAQQLVSPRAVSVVEVV